MILGDKPMLPPADYPHIHLVSSCLEIPANIHVKYCRTDEDQTALPKLIDL